MEELKTVEEIYARKRELSKELVKWQVILTNFAAEGAMISREGVMEARNGFGLAQYEILFLGFQLQQFENTGTLEGSLDKWHEYVERSGK